MKTNMGPFILHNDGGVTNQNMARFGQVVDEVVRVVEGSVVSGLAQVLYGDIHIKVRGRLIIRTIGPPPGVRIEGRIQGRYLRADDAVELRCFKRRKLCVDTLSGVLLHELGHRFWSKHSDHTRCRQWAYYSHRLRISGSKEPSELEKRFPSLYSITCPVEHFCETLAHTDSLSGEQSRALAEIWN